ncbi:hypothetical protein K2Q16_00555 [Patescibacteria group bacterium]|nr:hypothetical protein [Patescibacteria group bacterium]
MPPHTVKDSYLNIKKLSHSNEYYNSVFKKTERLISVMFYVLSYVEDTPRSKVHVDKLTERGMALYETALSSLSWTEPSAAERLEVLQQSVVALEGALRIAAGARVLTDELLAVLLESTDTITRYIKHHYFESTTTRQPAADIGRADRPAAVVRPIARSPRVQTRVAIPAGDISSDAHLVYSQLTDRGERIKTVLEAKPEATIKDIAEIITDVSEKTIQRELTSLIEKGQVIRQGERRWSKYSVAK